MSTIHTLPTPAEPSRSADPGSPVGRVVRGHPVLVATSLLIGITWLAQLVVLVVGWPPELALLVELVAFAAVPLSLSAVIGGRQEVRRLLAGFTRVRIGLARWLLVLLALPVLTVAVALVTGTYRAPSDGWSGLLVSYLLTGLLILGVSGNLAEEAAWSGFVQSRLMERHGLVLGSLLTAMPFSLIHLPLAFDQNGLRGTPWTEVALTWGVLIAVAPVMRLLIGCLLVDTRGSLLAVALLHASFNASGRLSVTGGAWWLNVVALLLLASLVFGHRVLGHALSGRRPRRTVQEKI